MQIEQIGVPVCPSSLANDLIDTAEQVTLILSLALRDIPDDAEMRPDDFDLMAVALNNFFKQAMMSLLVPSLREPLQMDLDMRLANVRELQRRKAGQ